MSKTIHVAKDELPSFEVSGKIQIIDVSRAMPRFRTIADCIPASAWMARRVIARHNLRSAWLVDDFGYKQYITL